MFCRDSPHFFSPPHLCYRCHCPPQLEGPDCQQTRLSFLGNGYAWFPPIRPCFDSHLSLEFMTGEDDGLLLYAGPLATLQPGDAEDYMAIGKECVSIIRCAPNGPLSRYYTKNLELNFVRLITGWKLWRYMRQILFVSVLLWNMSTHSPELYSKCFTQCSTDKTSLTVYRTCNTLLWTSSHCVYSYPPVS